jgi:hypothetical protein
LLALVIEPYGVRGQCKNARMPSRSQNVAKGRTPEGTPLLEVAAKRVGLRKAMKVLSFMVAWDHARDRLGHEPTIEEYAKWWKESAATAYRHQALFREAFPGESTPTRLLDLAAYQANVQVGSAMLGRTIIT